MKQLKILIQPLAIRVFHWVMVIAVTLLVLTGLLFYTNAEIVYLPFRTIRILHGTAGIILTANLLAHMYYYLVNRRYPEIVLNRSDIRNLKAFLKYYLFLRSDHPNFGRYNPGQKLIYDSWAVACLASAFAGYILIFPTDTTLLQSWFGGLQMMRIIKYEITIWFLATIPVHLYLVFTEDPAKLQAMFTGYISKEADTPPSASKLQER